MKVYSEEAIGGISELIHMSDMEFYEKYVADAPLEEQKRFLEEFPEFLPEKTI